jgi:hypothetical protein
MPYFLNDNSEFYDLLFFDNRLPFHDALQFHNVPLLLHTDLETIVSCPKAVSAGQFSSQRFSAADDRPFAKPLEKPVHSGEYGPWQVTEVAHGIGRQDNGRHCVTLTFYDIFVK